MKFFALFLVLFCLCFNAVAQEEGSPEDSPEQLVDDMPVPDGGQDMAPEPEPAMGNGEDESSSGDEG